jgi:hypothetical protein
MHPFTSLKELSRLQEIGELAYMLEKKLAAIQWMRTNPSKTLKLTAHRFRLFWFPSIQMWIPSSPARGLKAASFTLIGFFGLMELMRLVIARHDRAWLLMAVVVGPSLIYLLTHVDPRYRYPVFPLTSLLAFHFVFSVGQMMTRGLHPVTQK